MKKDNVKPRQVDALVMQIGRIEVVNISRSESNLDKACDSAYWLAVNKFGIDECGHSQKLTEWERSSCWVELEFSSYKRVGEQHYYTFTATAKKNIEE